MRHVRRRGGLLRRRTPRPLPARRPPFPARVDPPPTSLPRAIGLPVLSPLNKAVLRGMFQRMLRAELARDSS